MNNEEKIYKVVEFETNGKECKNEKYLELIRLKLKTDSFYLLANASTTNSQTNVLGVGSTSKNIKVGKILDYTCYPDEEKGKIKVLMAPQVYNKLIDLEFTTATCGYDYINNSLSFRLYNNNAAFCLFDNIKLYDLDILYASYLEDNEDIPEIDVRYHYELFPDLIELEPFENGDFVDLRSAEEVVLKAGEFNLINLGISMELPEGWWAQFVPRSSTFKNYGVIQTNSFAVIDRVYRGDDDIWMMPVYATRDCVIGKNERICQFRIVERKRFRMRKVDKLTGKNRGGFGTSGKL